MPVSPLAQSSDLVTATILVEGARLADVWLIAEIEIHKAVNRIPSATILLVDGSAVEETFEISESETFLPGKSVEISVGYDNQETAVFKGIIVKHGIRIRGAGTSHLAVTCMDRAAILTIGRKNTLFLKQKDSDIISTLLGDAGLESEVAATDLEHEEIVRYYATDWDFIVSRAEVNGRIVVVDDGKVSVKAPQPGGSSELIVRYGDALRTLEADIDARTQVPSVKGTSWDFAAQTLASGDSAEPEMNAQGNLTGAELASALGIAAGQLSTPAPLPQDGLAAWSSARLLKARLARIRGKVSFQGNATPKPGQLLELAGLGARFNGQAFVSGVVHRIRDGDWVTEVDFGLSPRWFVEEHSDIEAPSAAGLLPGIHGLHLGKVKQIDQDPDGQTRVLVDLPLISGDTGDGVWARLATGYATKDAGMFFMPEVDDEVVLGFVNGDPRAPLVLGSLYSSNQSPPYTPDADNTYKAIVTKNKVKITIDDVKKELKIETPGGQIATLSDDQNTITLVDSNKNKVEMASGGITLNSAADLTLKAGGKIAIEAGTGIDVKAGTDMNLEGLNLNAKASVGLTAQGQASAELTASGQLTLRGAMVMIN